MAANRAPAPNDKVMAGAVVAGAAVLAVLWAGACLSATVSGHHAPRGALTAPLLALTNPANPSAVWGQPVGPPQTYWALTAATAVLALAAAASAGTLWQRRARQVSADPRRARGLASRREVATLAGQKALLGKAASRTR